LLSKKKTKKELAIELVGLGLVDVHKVPSSLAELQEKANQHNLDLKVTVPLIVEDGWARQKD
jgi:hypothetical protein